MVDQEQNKEQEGLGSVQNYTLILFVCLFVCVSVALFSGNQSLNNRHFGTSKVNFATNNNIICITNSST